MTGTPPQIDSQTTLMQLMMMTKMALMRMMMMMRQGEFSCNVFIIPGLISKANASEFTNKLT